MLIKSPTLGVTGENVMLSALITAFNAKVPPYCSEKSTQDVISYDHTWEKTEVLQSPTTVFTISLSLYDEMPSETCNLRLI